MEAPHRVAGNFINALIGGVNSAGRTIVGTVQGAGKTVVFTLDKPVEHLTGKQGPIVLIDRIGDGAVSAGENVIEKGVFGTIQTAGEGISRTLDHPLEQISSMGRVRR